MSEFNALDSLKVQRYLNDQNLDSDSMDLLTNIKFKNLISADEKANIERKVNKYRELEKSNLCEPLVEKSNEMQKIAQDVMYITGKSITSIKMNDFNTEKDIEQIMLNSNLRSRNDLFVDIDYEDCSSSSNYVKCKIVNHNYVGAYGIVGGARIAVNKFGDIIVGKNSLYLK